jgi:hypothetical protein
LTTFKNTPKEYNKYSRKKLNVSLMDMDVPQGNKKYDVKKENGSV